MSYTCPRCGIGSHNPNDERERYCGRCHQFEDAMNAPSEILCPTCPMCDHPPMLAISWAQAFCETPGCPTFCWDMTVTKAENRRGMTVHDLDSNGFGKATD